MTATYVKRFVIGHVAVLMHIANEDLSARIGQWLSDFEVERFDENDEENAIVVVIRGLRRGEPIPYKIPAGVEAHHESEAASYYRGDGLWIVAGKNGGAAFVDRSRKTIGMYVDSENVKTSQGALEHAMHPLFELLRQQGLYICHAGGVADGAYGLLLPGKSGQGKSTLSVDLMSGGLAYLSDDRVFLRETDRGFEMIGFYEPARLFASNVSHLPGLADGARPSEVAGKEEVDIRAKARNWGLTAELNALLFPQWAAGEKSRLEPIAPGQALMTILPLTLVCFDPETSKAQFDFLARLARLPAMRLIMGDDRERWRELAAEFIRNNREERAWKSGQESR